MEVSTTMISSSTGFPISSKDIAPQACVRGSVSSVRRRKPTITYQSPGSGLVDMGLLAHNTRLELEAAAAAFALRDASSTSASASARSPSAIATAVTTTTTSSSSSKLLHKPPPKEISLPSQEALTRLKPSLYRSLSIPRPPPRLYHAFTRIGITRSSFKRSTSITSLNSQGRALDSEPERRSSSRARRPAPKVRDTESTIESAEAPPERPSPAKRKRGGGAGGRRRRTATQQEADDSAYPATKRPRKLKERVDMDVDGDDMPPPDYDTSPSGGYSTRARKPRLGRADSSTSDRSASVALAIPANGTAVEEFGTSAKAT